VVQKSAIQTGFESPFIEVTRPILGNNGKYAVAFVAALLILANLFGGVWGVSRLVYSLGRDKILPEVLAVTQNGTPLRAVFVVVLCLLVSVFLDSAGVIHIKDMLSLAGQNFLILYGVAAAALLMLTRQLKMKLLAIFVLLLVLTLLFIAGVHTLYPVCLVLLASITHWMKKV
jgi:amino acid efflux transporter